MPNLQRFDYPPDVLLVMVPGVNMRAADFHAYGLTTAVEQRGWRIAVATVDLELDAYLDGSVEVCLLDSIAEAQRAVGARRIWLAGISLGCQAILRCVRSQPDLAEGLILLTPYLASTGLIAEVNRAGGLRCWLAASGGRPKAERALLDWLAKTPSTLLPHMLLGHATRDRFAATTTMLADLIPADQVITVSGEHDWASWRALWHLMLDQHPFERQTAAAS